MKTIGKTEEELNDELRPVAEKNVTRSLVVQKVSELEGIEVSATEIDAEAERMVQSAEQRGEELRQLLASPAARSSLMRNLHTKKTIDHLLEMALGNEGSTPTSAG